MTLVSSNDSVRPTSKIASLEEDICLCCGVCRTGCNKNALELKTREKRVITPVNSVHRVVMMAIEKALPMLIDKLIEDTIEKGKEKEIKTVSGRNRININGVYSPCDNVTIVRSTDSVNAFSTLLLIQSITQKHPELKRIIIFHDNARYNHSKYLKERLPTNVEMRPLPPYSPNLNLIERLWKFFRKEVMNNHYHESFDDFKKASSNFFRSLRGRTDDLDSLMSRKFSYYSANVVLFTPKTIFRMV